MNGIFGVPHAPCRDSLTDPVCKDETQAVRHRCPSSGGRAWGQAAPTGPPGSHPQVVTPESNKWEAGCCQDIFSQTSLLQITTAFLLMINVSHTS